MVVAKSRCCGIHIDFHSGGGRYLLKLCDRYSPFGPELSFFNSYTEFGFSECDTKQFQQNFFFCSAVKNVTGTEIAQNPIFRFTVLFFSLKKPPKIQLNHFQFCIKHTNNNNYLKRIPSFHSTQTLRRSILSLISILDTASQCAPWILYN